jgi:hypothetical protein
MNKLKVLELFEGLKIKVYDNGQIETLNHTNIRKNGRIDNRKGKILKPKIDKYGYQVITLSKNGIRKSYTIHQLVAKAFIPNPKNKKTINHKDGNKLNNKVDNLEWATEKENQQHKWKNGLANYNRDEMGRFV